MKTEREGATVSGAEWEMGAWAAAVSSRGMQES